jgi:hypothetical protein
MASVDDSWWRLHKGKCEELGKVARGSDLSDYIRTGHYLIQVTSGGVCLYKTLPEARDGFESSKGGGTTSQWYKIETKFIDALKR